MDEAEALCDRVAIVDHGRVIALGTPRELIASLGAEHVVEFALRAGEPPDGRRAGRAAGRARTSAPATAATALHRAARCTWPCPRCSPRSSGTAPGSSRLTTHHATLEDVFVSLTGRHLRDD